MHAYAIYKEKEAKTMKKIIFLVKTTPFSINHFEFMNEYVSIVKKSMPSDLDARNDQIMFSCSKVRYSEKIDIFVIFWYFYRHDERMANDNKKVTTGLVRVDKSTIRYASSKWPML